MKKTKKNFWGGGGGFEIDPYYVEILFWWFFEASEVEKHLHISSFSFFFFDFFFAGSITQVRVPLSTNMFFCTIHVSHPFAFQQGKGKVLTT